MRSYTTIKQKTSLFNFFLCKVSILKGKNQSAALKKLEQLQWFEKTNPQNPTAPDQKYKLPKWGKCS